jgi:hypothetical protein
MTIMKTTCILSFCSIITVAAVICGCASDKITTAENPASATQTTPAAKQAYKNREYVANPSKIKFGEFDLVELKATELPAKENTEGNGKSAKIIDNMLVTALKSIWPNLKEIPAGAEFSKGGERTLQITPQIEHIHLVSVGARIWVGVMAGGSDLIMHVDYRDSSTGEIIANPDFWKGNGAWSGGWSHGATDNQIRDAVVAQIFSYASGNK